MVFVDTSVWITALRAGKSAEAEGLRALLDADQVALAAPVRVELLSGAAARDSVRLKRVLSALPRFLPDGATWNAIEAFVERAAVAGQRFGVADLLIAGIAAQQQGSIWTLDADFERMAALRFIELHRVARA